MCILVRTKLSNGKLCRVHHATGKALAMGRRLLIPGTRGEENSERQVVYSKDGSSNSERTSRSADNLCES